MLDLFIAQDLARKRFKDKFEARTPVEGKARAPGSSGRPPARSRCRADALAAARPVGDSGVRTLDQLDSD